MDRNIGAPNRRIPLDVQPKGSTARDLERSHDVSPDEVHQAAPQPQSAADVVDFD